MLEAIKIWWKQQKCEHNFEFDGHNGTDKESMRHWHVHTCTNCGASREVMNMSFPDACGHY